MPLHLGAARCGELLGLGLPVLHLLCSISQLTALQLSQQSLLAILKRPVSPQIHSSSLPPSCCCRVYCLAANPEKEVKMLQEIDGFGRDKQLSMEDVQVPS